MPLHSLPQFIMIRCACQRTLRAKWEQIGTEIQCWDCGANVPVHLPRSQSRLPPAMVHAVANLLRGPGGSAIVLGATVLTLALSLPAVGLALGSVLLVLGGLIYLAALQADDIIELDRHSALWGQIRRARPPQVALAAALMGGTVLPLWVLGLGHQQSPHLSGWGLALFGLTWSVGPIVALLQTPAPAEGDAGRPGWAERLGPLRRHPITTLAVLLIVPLGLILTEAIQGGIFLMSHLLSLAILDYLPHPPSVFSQRGYAFDGVVSYHDLPDSRFLADYGQALRRGYTFVGAIPPSFTVASRWGVETHGTIWTPTIYLLCRLGAVLLTCLGLLVSGAVQARCLNVLAHARQRRLA